MTKELLKSEMSASLEIVGHCFSPTIASSLGLKLPDGGNAATGASLLLYIFPAPPLPPLSLRYCFSF